MNMGRVKPARYIRYAVLLPGMYLSLGVTVYLPLALGRIAVAANRL